MTLVLPPPLVPGDALRIIAPSGPCDAALLWPGLAWMRTRYRIEMSPGALERDGYLAGPDRRRRLELERAMAAPGVKAIVATRGGYGAMRILEDAAWSDFAERPKWIVGHSDVTALHAMAWRAGIASLHAPNVTGLSRALPSERGALLACLERPGAPRAWRGLRELCSGQARGVLVGGNLSLLCAMAAATRLFIPRGAVLAIEDVAEAPYRIDRMLTSLLLGEHLSRVAAFVLGSFERSRPGPDGRGAEEVIEERLRPLGVPVVAGAPFGHGCPNEAFVLGAPVLVRAGEVHFGG